MQKSFQTLIWCISFVLVVFTSGFAQDAADVYSTKPNPVKVDGSIVPHYIPNVVELGEIYDNGPVVNAPGGGPGGADGSVLQVTTLGLNTLGAGWQLTAGNSLADDFTVPTSWTIDSIKVYGYQTGSTTTSTYTGLYIKIYNGDPSAGGTLIYGDFTTNRMVNTYWINAYRYSDNGVGTTRPVMAIVGATPGLTLPAGNYWVEVTATGSLTSGPWMPPITITGQAVTGNAKQNLAGIWQNFLDTGTGTPAQGIPFKFFGIAGTPPPLNAFNLTFPPDGITVTTLPGSSTPVTITWDTSSALASYKWIFGAPTVPPRILEVPVGTNSLTLTLGQIDAILAGLGVAQGDSVVGQWDVWAYRNNAPDYDSLKSTNGPLAITLKRGVPALSPFDLVSPPDGITLVTSVFNNNPVTINWTRSGPGATYKWKFGVNVVTSPILTVPSGNGGLDTSLTLINSSIDGILAGLGLNPGDSVVGQWAVWAYSGSDSLKSTQTYAITLKRQAKGEYLIAYDSTLTNGRISRDSVTAALGSLGYTFDLFNKGGNTSTNVMSFRGYKVIWLGEGTSMMSNIQKDSIKAFLNSGTPSNKSSLIIFGEDVGYNFGRTGSTYLDLDFANNYLGWNYVLDRPATGANQGLIGVTVNPGIADSTIGPWPDVLALFGTTSEVLYHFRYDATAYNGIGNKTANFEVATFGVDVESLRPAIDSPAGSPVIRFLTGAVGYIPVELTSFTASLVQNNVLLNWTTATELNNSGFEVQRRVTGSDYSSIGFIEGKGTTTKSQDYSFTDYNLALGKYSYRLKQIDFDGSVNYSPEIEVDVNQPIEFNLSQNYPNPFNPSTTIKFSLAFNSKVEMKVFDVLGQEVISLINKEMQAGYHEVVFDASPLSSGVYFYRIDASGVDGQKFSSVKKMILTK